ncbi:MAG TPA: DUF4340 domain-containing protein [Thermodesulfobacteriota bacterium]|nr:DUF4340 domain-containing protein [Thermodesulfobacteriota bacterium]
MGNHLRKFAGTLIAILILALLLAYLFLFELKKTSEEGEGNGVVFTDVNKEQINEISLKYPSQTVICQKKGEGWFVLKDSKGFKADDNIISRMIADISDMKMEKVVSENPTDLSGFGLSQPKVEVLAKAPDKEIRLAIGDESPVGTGTYILANGENKVLLVERGSILSFLDQSVDDIRDKQVVKLSEDKLKGMRFKSGGLTFELERKDGEWAGKDILEYVEIDQDKISSVASTLSNLRIRNFEDDEPEGLKSYGLDSPGTEVELIQDGETIHILFGNKKEDGGYYLKLSSGDSIYSVPDYVFAQVPKELNDFRVVRVVKLDPENVSRVEIERGGDTISILREDGNWVLENEKDKNVDEEKVQDLLEEINDITVEDFVDDNPSDLTPYGLDKPEVQITVSEGDKKTTLLFGKTENEKVYAKVSDEKSVYALHDEILTVIPSSKDELLEK